MTHTKKKLQLSSEFISQEVTELSHISKAHFKKELIDLKEHYTHHIYIISFKYNCTNNSKISGYMAKLLAIFGSIWLCESIFSLVNFEITVKTIVPGNLVLVLKVTSVKFCSVTQSCPTLCNSMDCSTPSLPAHHQLPEFTQTHVHWVADAIQPSHPLLSPSSPALNLSQH